VVRESNPQSVLRTITWGDNPFTSHFVTTCNDQEPQCDGVTPLWRPAQTQLFWAKPGYCSRNSEISDAVPL